LGFLSSLDVSASGLAAQRIRMNVISSNLANVETTRTPEGGPYRRRDVIFAAEPAPSSFPEILGDAMGEGLDQVNVVDIIVDEGPPRSVYNPNHPDADAAGYVAMPNINVVEEMVNMLSATRSYEANVTAIQSAKSMALKALEIAK